MSIRCCLTLIVLLFSTTLAGAAESTALVDQGRTLAACKCAVCHAVGERGESPHRAAPPLRTLHENYPIKMLADAILTNVLSGHDEMPMFEFSRNEMMALLSFIDSLSPAGARYLREP